MILLPAQKCNSLLILNSVGTVYRHYRVRSKSFLPSRHAEKGIFSRSVHTLDRSIDRSNYREGDRKGRFPQRFHFPPNRLFFPSLALRATQGQKPKHCAPGEQDLALTSNGIGFGQGAKSSRSDGDIVLPWTSGVHLFAAALHAIPQSSTSPLTNCGNALGST